MCGCLTTRYIAPGLLLALPLLLQAGRSESCVTLATRFLSCLNFGSGIMRLSSHSVTQCVMNFCLLPARMGGSGSAVLAFAHVTDS